MLDVRSTLLALAIIPALGGITLACGDEPGGVVGFHDASEGCNGSTATLERPVAVGARLDVRVDLDGEDVIVTNVEVDAPDVFEVVQIGNPFTVRALAAGTALVSVRAGGVNGDRLLRAADIASATVAPDPLTVWNLDDNLTVLPNDPTGALVAQGVAVLPDARLQLGVTLRDAAGEELLGYDVAGWQSEPAGAVTFEAVGERSDDVVVLHGGTDGPVTITTVGGGSYTVELSSGPADHVAAWLPDTRETVDAVTVPVGETLAVELLAWDADGRLLLGNGPDGFTATVLGDAGSADLVAPPWSDELELDAEGEAVLRGLRVVWIGGSQPGESTVRFSAAGQTLDLPVTVTAP